MSIFQYPAKVRIVIAESSVQARKTMQDALKASGFTDVIGVACVNDVIEILETEHVSWVITGLDEEEKTNALHLLTIVTQNPQLKQLRVSLSLRENQFDIIPLAFELGAFSVFDRAKPGQYDVQVKSLVTTLTSAQYDSTLTAYHYLRDFLNKQMKFVEVTKLVEAMLRLMPGSYELLLHKAESLIQSGSVEEGTRILRQVRLFGEPCSARADSLLSRFAGQSLFDDENPAGQSNSADNPLGIETALIIDPDTIVHHHLNRYLETLGVPKIVSLTNGNDAWEWLNNNPLPGLIIMEWRIPGLDGPWLLQRMAEKNMHNVPLIVASSLLKPEDHALVRDLGILCLIEKPFEHEAILPKVVWALQQLAKPTEERTFVEKFRRFLKQKNFKGAERVYQQFMEHTAISTFRKTALSAEYEFHKQNYPAASDLAIEALKENSDDIALLNILGRSLLRLENFPAAENCFEKMRELSPKNVETICLFSETKLELGETDRAEEALSDAKELDAGSDLVKQLEAKLALRIGDVERAGKVLSVIDSLSNVVAYLNNRAVALTRMAKFEQGVKLYNDALAALPQGSETISNIIRYNLALAYIRYSDYEMAQETLENVSETVQPRLRDKVASLKSRLEKAIKTGADLVIGSAEVPAKIVSVDSSGEGNDVDKKKGSGQPKEKACDLMLRLQSLSVDPGDLCLFRVYFSTSLITADHLKLTANPRRFKFRGGAESEDAIKRSGAA